MMYQYIERYKLFIVHWMNKQLHLLYFRFHPVHRRWDFSIEAYKINAETRELSEFELFSVELEITEEDFNQIIQKIISCSGKDNIPSYSVGYQWYSKIMNLTKQLKETDLLMYEQKNNYYKLVRNLK